MGRRGSTRCSKAQLALEFCIVRSGVRMVPILCQTLSEHYCLNYDFDQFHDNLKRIKIECLL